jgi:hypothetical protein
MRKYTHQLKMNIWVFHLAIKKQIINLVEIADIFSPQTPEVALKFVQL